jgi:hypothetical protein
MMPVQQYGPNTVRRIANGPQAARAATAIVKAIQERRDQWPYPHVYPPETSLRRDPMGSCGVPAAAAQFQILQFAVPSGFYFYMTQLGLFWDDSSSFHFGDFFFTVDQNTPLGALPLTSVPLEDWQNIPFPLGSSHHGPLTLPRAELFSPEDVIRAKVTNVNLGGGGGSFGAWFGGWLIPTTEIQFAE